MFLELFANIDMKNVRSSRQGIFVNIFDPSGKEVAEYTLL